MPDYRPREIRSDSDKVHDALIAIRDIGGFRSVNEFLVAFYSSENPIILDLARRSLQYREDHPNSFLPRRILPLWLKLSSITGENQIRVLLTEQVATSVKDECNRAIRINDLRLDLEDDRLAAGLSILSKLYNRYQELLPCLCLILSTTLLASNKYELSKKTAKQGKDETAIRVCFLLFSSSL
jgi:hypothetical protein